MDISSSREIFFENWLQEAPEKLENYSIGSSIAYDIDDRISHCIGEITDLSKIYPNLYKLETTNRLYYWVELNGQKVLSCGLHKNSSNLTVFGVSKTSDSALPPYASDLYLNILLDQKSVNKTIRLSSDDLLSTSGIRIWKRLLATGNSISVYDRDNPGSTFKTIETQQELESYYGNGDHRRYQYVLSETHSEGFLDTKSSFELRRIQELSGSFEFKS